MPSKTACTSFDPPRRTTNDISGHLGTPSSPALLPYGPDKSGHYRRRECEMLGDQAIDVNDMKILDEVKMRTSG
jgi:hypothetical protein